jgi:hypothetical protein
MNLGYATTAIFIKTSFNALSDSPWEYIKEYLLMQ